MGTKTRASAAVLLAAVALYFVARSPRAESPQDPSPSADSPRGAVVVPPAADGERGGPADASTFTLPAGSVERMIPVAEDPPVEASAVAGTHVLRVVLEGITAEDARMATVTVTGVDKHAEWPAEIQDSWPWPGLPNPGSTNAGPTNAGLPSAGPTNAGLTSDFDLDPFLALVAAHDGDQRVDALEVSVAHPAHFLATTRVPLSRGVELESGQTVHEVRVRLVRPEFWPEFTLAVRDAHTRVHLEDIELRIEPGVGNAVWGQNGTNTLLDDGLDSPILLMGGREPSETKATVAGLALSPATGEVPRLVELVRRFGPERGVIVSARAPGYAWGSTSLDVTKGERELLLEPATTLGVRLANVQLERYAALETVPVLGVYRHYPNGNVSYIHFERLDETLATEGLRLDSLVPADNYVVTVELGGGSWTQRPLLAREEITLDAGETRELVLSLADPPAPPERATLGGVVSFPAPSATWGEEHVRLQLYFQPTQHWRNPDVEFALADLPQVGGALPTWSFRADDLPVGLYRVQLLPFLKVWMIDLPAGGREDVRLEIKALAEVHVETVDGQTGARVPLDEFYYRNQQPLPRQRQNDWARAETVEPGRFRIWTTPGTVTAWPRFPSGSDLEYGGTGKDFELVPGLQSVRFELGPVYAMHFEFREDGVALPVGDPGMYVRQNIRAVDHEGRVTGDGLQTTMRVTVSGPGVYEINFEGLDADHYHPLPPRRVHVRAGEPVEVIVELPRK